MQGLSSSAWHGAGEFRGLVVVVVGFGALISGGIRLYPSTPFSVYVTALVGLAAMPSRDADDMILRRSPWQRTLLGRVQAQIGHGGEGRRISLALEEPPYYCPLFSARPKLCLSEGLHARD